MKVAVTAEIDAGEPRVAATPETVKKIVGLGAEVAVEPGAGLKSGILDADYSAAGATVTADAVNGADIVLKVRRPWPPNSRALSAAPSSSPSWTHTATKTRCAPWPMPACTAFAMELLPRITRAQVDGRAFEPGQSRRLSCRDRRRRRVWPRVADDDDRGRHRAGHARSSSWAQASPDCKPSRPPAASAPSLPQPTCARPPRNRCESLGAKFIAVEDEEFKAAETAGGYAKEMSKEYQAKQAALVAEHVKKQDIVITTALIPGRPAPRLISKEMVASMRPGSVIVDLAVERGGNVEGVKADTVADVGGVRSSATATWRAGSPPPRQAFTPRTSTPSSNS